MRLLDTRLGFKRALAFFVVCTLVLSLLISSVVINRFALFFRLNQQELNWDLANHLAQRWQEQEFPAAELEKVNELLVEIEHTNPDVELYLLDRDGLVVAAASGIDKLLERKIEPAFIEKLLLTRSRQRDPRLFGVNPINPHILEPVGVAAVDWSGKQAYLYTVLVSRVRASYLERSYRATRGAAVAISVGVLIFGVVMGYFVEFTTNRKQFEEINKVINSINSGDLSARVSLSSGSELLGLGGKINQIAEKLYQAFTSVQQSDRMRRELISNVSHDLNTPLASALGYVRRTLQEDASMLSERGKRYLGHAETNLEMLGRLIRELFELSKLETKQLELNQVRFSILDVVSEEVFPSLRELAEGNQVTLSLESPESLPLVYADDSLVLRVITNLVENAIRYHKPGGRVLVRLIPHEKTLEVAILDDGPGIAEAELERIFDRFYRGDQSRKKGSGTGLGLAIVKKILEAHNKNIAVTSELGVGTRFSFELDLAESEK